MKYLFLLALCGALFAQNNDFAPAFVQSTKAGTVNTNPSFDKNVGSGDMEVLACDWPNGAQSISPTSTLGTSFTLKPASPITLSDSGGTINMQMAYGQASSSGAETITIGGTATNFTCSAVELAPQSGGSLSFDTSNSATQSVNPTWTISDSVTTGTNGDILVSAASTWFASVNIYSNTDQIVTGTGGFRGFSMGAHSVGNAGSYTTTYNVNQNNGVGSGSAFGLITLAFAPSAITITTKTLPDGAQTTAYGACLKAVGGSGAYTWSALSGLPA